MLTDVIAAIATPPGRSALALVRISGRGAHQVAARVVKPFATEPLRTARRASAVDPASGERLDEVLYAVYREPASYTGEDLVELSTHGGLLVPMEVLAALLRAGARPAEAGEFSRRAVQHGKMDLLQAEAVGDLIDATAAAQRRAALGQYDRALTRRIAALRERVLELEALVCYEIDFPEEDSGPVPPERINAAVVELRDAVAQLLATAGEGTRLREGALVVIAGRPNAGKSSLFNALLGTERAIVTDIPGTTRDAIEAGAVCEGFPFRLVDTAGIREDAGRIERLGIEVSRRYLAAADVVLFCVESGRAPDGSEQDFLGTLSAPSILVRTKADAYAQGSESEPGAGGERGLPVSAVTGSGLAVLRSRLAEVAFSSLAGQADLAPMITRARHRVALERAGAELDEFAAARAAGLPTAIAATHLRAAVTALDDLIGLVTPDDVLERVFATFCVGK